VKNGKVLDYLTGGETTSNQETEANGTTIAGTTALDYPAPFLLDIVPETKGSWKEEIANAQSDKTVTTTGSSTVTVGASFTRNSDLSYLRSLTFAYSQGGNYTETDTVAANGSAEDQNDFPVKNPTAGMTTWSAPKKVGGKYVIAVVYTPPSGQPTTTNVPDWYPGGKKVEKLVTDTKKDTGTTKVPKECGKVTAGQTAVKLVETTAFLDPEQGTYDTETQTTYVVAGEGRVCEVNDYLNETYDNRVTGALTTSVAGNSVAGLTGESLQKLRTQGLAPGFPGANPRE
jgi:hypothetical protein